MSNQITRSRVALFILGIGIALIPLYGFCLFVTQGHFLLAAVYMIGWFLIPQVDAAILVAGWLISHYLTKIRFKMPPMLLA